VEFAVDSFDGLDDGGTASGWRRMGRYHGAGHHG
jgi:hypothetical protein